MPTPAWKTVLALGMASAVLVGPSAARGAKVTVNLGPSGGNVSFVGAMHRWDEDGNPRRQVNPRQKIDAPEADAAAVKESEGKWVFEDLRPGKYDLVILARDRLRVEGWQYAPVLDFDP